MGTGTFAVPALLAVREHVSLVVTQPARPSGRGLQLKPTPIAVAAHQLGLPIETPEKCRAPEFVERLAALQPEILLVAAYGQILSQAVLDTAGRGGINLHCSILPEYRGAAPIQRAILDGKTETGVCLMQMDKGMDTGDVIDIDRIAIQPDATYGEVQDQLAEVAATMAAEWLPALLAGNYHRTSQDHDRATMAPKVGNEEGELSFERPAQGEYDRFRAFTPSPGAFMKLSQGLLRVHEARLSTAIGNPGEALSVGEGCTIAFAQGSIEFKTVQWEGKKRVSGRDFANGMRLKPGSFLR